MTSALEVLQREMDISMALCGVKTIDQLTRDVLLVPEGFEGRWQA